MIKRFCFAVTFWITVTFWIKKWRFQFRAASLSSLLTKSFESDGEVLGSSLVGESLHRW